MRAVRSADPGRASRGLRRAVGFSLALIGGGGIDRYPLPRTSPRLAGIGLGTGALAGFFGFGGGFLIVRRVHLRAYCP